MLRVVTDSTYRYAERHCQGAKEGQSEIFAAGGHIPALATSASAFGACAPSHSKEVRG